jgi:hypothetical protein
MSRLKSMLLAVVAVAAVCVQSASAASVPLNSAPTDTRANGSSTIQPDGSVRLQTFTGDSTGKADVVFFTGGVLGTLDKISSFSADFFKASTPVTANPANELAIRLFTNAAGTQGLVWENNYNGNSTVATDVWQTNDFTHGLFWERTDGANYDFGSNFKMLSDYSAGFTPSGSNPASASLVGASIYGIQVSYGSSVGPFDGSVANVKLSFTGGNDYIGAPFTPAVTPLPSGALGGMALLGVTAAFGVIRNKRRAIA